MAYEHFVPEVDKNDKFPDGYNFELIDNLDKLEDVLSEVEDYLAWDLETTDLDPRQGKIVGIALGHDDETGYYVPLRHAVGENIEDAEKALDMCYEAMKKCKKTFVYNMRFDFRFMEFEGYDMSIIPYYDVCVGIWLADTNKKFPSLKWSARHFLGFDMQTFEETLGDNANFEFVEPTDATVYAGADALVTYILAGVSIKYFKESKMAGKIDNKILYPLMKFEDNPLPINVPYLEDLLLQAQKRYKELEKDIFSIFGYDLNLNSGQQLSEALDRLGLHTGEYTKTGYMSTKKSLIKKIDHPVADKLIEYKELAKLINSYIDNLAKYAKEEEGFLRFAYKTIQVPTGRLACGGDKKNDYFAKINLQSIPKADSRMWYVHEADEKHSDDENVIMGYRFSLDEKSDKVCEGFDPHLNVRKAFLPDKEDEFYWVSVDYSSQELRIPTNLSREPVWLDAFTNNKDPHKQTAVKLFGEENYDRDKRKKAKGMNFGQII